MTLRFAWVGLAGLALAGLALASGCSGSEASSMQATQAGIQRGAEAPSASPANPDADAARNVAAKGATDKSGDPDAAKAEDLARNYERLQLMTDKPVPIALEILTLCASYSLEQLEQIETETRKRSGPHAFTAIRVFMNDSAAAAFRDSVAAYPAGAVIVKEKQVLPKERSETPTAVAGMIKREAGYDPQHGDWEYFYVDDQPQLERGKIASCVECHRRAAETGYVFGDWAKRDEPTAERP
ncbi:MAG TPA: cytochrome P460 family protein [Pirellulales bacterium]|nr:cytochrome P460 family protein [Pirellulales bacterium]